MTASKKSGLGVGEAERVDCQELLSKNSTLCNPCEKYAVSLRINAELSIRSLITRSTKVFFKANVGLKALALQSKASEQSIAWRCNWVLRLRFLFCDFRL